MCVRALTNGWSRADVATRKMHRKHNGFLLPSYSSLFIIPLFFLPSRAGAACSAIYLFINFLFFRFVSLFAIFLFVFFFSLLLLRLLCVCVYHPTNQVERVFRVLKNSVSTLISVLFFLLFQRNAILFFVYYLRARAKIKSRPLHVNKRIALN